MFIPRPSGKHRATLEELEAIYRMTFLPPFEEGFVISSFRRETAIEMIVDPETYKAEVATGYLHPLKRG